MIFWVLFALAEVVGITSAIVATIKENDDLFLFGYLMIMIPAILLLFFQPEL